MDRNSDTVKNFELLLREDASNKLPTLYSGTKHEEPGNNSLKLTLCVEQVISNVSKQIKAIQSADCRKNVRSTRVNINKYKKSTFIPVNMLDGAEVVPQNININIETQCVTDTELINIVQDAEELVSHRGMTQEFDTSFCAQEVNIPPVQKVIDNDDLEENEGEERKENNLNNEEPMFTIIDISLKEPDRIDDVDSLFDAEDENNAEQVSDKTDDADSLFDVENENNGEKVFTEIENQAQYNMLKNTPIVDKNKCINNRDDIDLPSSPVFNVKAVKKSMPLPPLVFELEAFEEFEKIALPIVEKNEDQETAKCFINSQILGKEFCSHLGGKPVLYEDELDQVSPVIEWSENKFSFDQVMEYLPEKDKPVFELKSPQSSILKDEILFSSDEENECGLQEYYVEDLPFTCALATSFYEQSHVLDKTMYVGFQTASNKSIQICTDSFYKAKSILDEFETNVPEKPSLTELVEMCDGQNPTSSKDFKVDSSDTNDIKTVCEDTIEFLDCKYDKITSEKEPVNRLLTLRELSEKSVKTFQTLEGFKTASNKKICLSKEALKQTNSVFKNIDLNEIDNFEVPVLQQESVKDKKELNLDESILLEFQNNDMSQENLDKHKTVDVVKFKTASNKSIQISDMAVEKSKKIFQDIESPDNDKHKTVDVVKFKTASNKSIQISDMAVEKSKKIFQDIESPDNDNVNDTNLHLIERLHSKQSNIGFKTASNKEIKISDQAMAKTVSLFSDIESLDDKYMNFGNTKNKLSNIDLGKATLDHQSTGKIPFGGFKTASNKEIKISDDALVKTKKIFEDISGNNTSNENIVCFAKTKSEYPIKVTNKRRFDDIDNTSKNYTSNDFVGFQTASNKRIKISKEAIMRSRKLLEEVEKDAIGSDDTEKMSRTMERNINKVQREDFQNASKELIDISEHAMEKDKVMFERNSCKNSTSSTSFKSFQSTGDVYKNNTEQALFKRNKLFENIDDTDVKCVNSFKGFKTASNKHIEISEDALAKCKKVFENIDDNQDETPFTGFQTASNKKVDISHDALIRSKTMFENIDLDNKTINIKNVTKFQGFATASNKKVNISPRALARSRKIFENIDVKSEPEPIERVEKGSFQGFQTASKKKVKISETALARSRKIFENIGTDIDLHEGEFQGFQTASNKKVNISETALARSKKILENISSDIDQDESVPTNNAFRGFQTGNNKKINVSEQALAKSRKLLDSIQDENHVIDSPRGSPFKGFQTANNKEVKITEEALAKSKGIFQDIDIAFQNTDHSTDVAMSQVIPVKSANNTMKNMSKASFKESKSDLTDSVCKRSDERSTSETNEYLAKNISVKVTKDTFNIENVIDTQVINDFDKSLHTEDFSTAITPVKSKRSGSPILSCPKAKRRKKFETPYNKTPKTIVIPVNLENNNRNDGNKLQTHNFDETYKKSKKYSLVDLHKMEKENPDLQNKVDPYIFENNFENSLHFEFSGARNELSNENWTTDYLKEYFLNSVNKKFVPDGWIDNHLKLIIWKLLSYEIKFSKTLGVVCTSRNVIEQLKYRYDKELFNSERPALRKIMEKDDVSTKLMVLCVAAVYEDGIDVEKVANQKNVELLVTDGWYCVRASLDRMLSKLVADGKIVVGSKIVTSGAELVGCEQGIAPWEDTSQIRLKLYGNSTRRARWLARLGYHGNGAILTRLRDVNPDGGKVAKLRVFVARVYPTLYIEKFDDGSTVTRSERLELLHQMKYENERQALLEKLYEEVQKEFSDEESQDSEVDPELKRRWLESGSQIAKAMKKSRDPAEFKATLTESQVELLNDHTTRKRDRLIQSMQARVEERIAESGLNVRRNVVPLMKIRIADVGDLSGNVEVTRGLMSIWKPNEAILEVVKEGAWIEAMNVTPTAIRYSEIQISAGRQSIFSQWKHKENEKVKSFTKSMERICYSIKNLTKNPSMATDYNEIDTVGLVFLIEPSNKEFDSNKSQFQNVYLADAEKNMVTVNFWGGLKKLGFENVLGMGQVVACMNLQKRAGNTRKNIPQYRVTEFSYFTKTPKHDGAKNICEDLNNKLHGVDKLKFCDDCVNLKSNYFAFKMHNYSENVSPYRYQNIDFNLSKNRMFIDSPLSSKGGKNDENLNLSGLDFESTFKQVDTQEYSPKTLLRKRQVKEKIDKLKMYGEPPALSPIQIMNKSKNAGSAFKSPLPKCDVSRSVANASEILLKEKNLDNSVPCSPVLMNKTFVKRTINPVKLDFSSVAIDESNVSDTIDHFAEEFDGSPPLSLD